jgi:hypothetical protein
MEKFIIMEELFYLFELSALYIPIHSSTAIRTEIQKKKKTFFSPNQKQKVKTRCLTKF